MGDRDLGEDHRMGVVLAARSVSAGYSGVPAIHNVDIELNTGEMVLLAGPNGAGKSTTVMTLAGAIAPLGGDVEVDGQKCRLPLFRRTRGGLGVITEQRTVFMNLSVSDNIRLGRGKPEDVLKYFPELEKRLKVKAGLISGGEQQMLSVGRVLAANPQVVLADELSLGLAPIVVKRLLTALRLAADGGAAVLLVEQHVRVALDVVNRGYFLRRGRIELHGTREELRHSDEAIQAIYL
jgi:branched-chain amino acid transport system ATP-binding protein